MLSMQSSRQAGFIVCMTVGNLQSGAHLCLLSCVACILHTLKCPTSLSSAHQPANLPLSDLIIACRSEFTFSNPNSKGSCGCGESFTT